MKNKGAPNSGGGGITPPTYTIIGIKALIDWFTLTTDRIKYNYKNNRYSIDPSSNNDLNDLITTLTGDKEWFEYDKEYGLNGFKDRITIGEFIQVHFYGPKNLQGRNTTMINLSGQACREFLGRGGSYIELIKLMNFWDAKCTRFDLSIDDHEGDICDIYDLWKNYIEPCYYTSPFHDHDPRMPMNNKTRTYKGFGIYFGRKGSNQLLIYDKKLEREYAGESVFDYKKWYRYEMRFMGGKANTIMNKYLLNLLKSTEDFSRFAKECLFGVLDVKTPSNDSNINRWPTAPFWLKFLDQVEKLQIVNEYRPEPTIEKKEKWVDSSVDKTLAKLYLTKPNFFIERFQNISMKMKDFKDKDIEEINKYLRKNDEEEISKDDVLKISNDILANMN